MNYDHAYHAGNFADVFKHIILIHLIKSFLKKETAFCYLDTHAGAGCYDLNSTKAELNKEYMTGIEKILLERNPPEWLHDYLHCINLYFSKKLYPGSPLIARHFLRANDRMILSEWNPTPYQLLKHQFAQDRQVAVHCQNGYQSLKASLPPKERRGLILIDPPYEKMDEIDLLIQLLPKITERFETGVYALWYPIKNRLSINNLLQALQEQIHRPYLIAEISIYPEDLSFQLNGCGMMIINPPWKLNEELAEILPWLWKTLSIHQKGRYQIKTS